MDADAVGEILFDFFAVGAGEFLAGHRVFERGLFRRGAEVEAHQVLRGLGGVVLRKVDEIDGRFVRSEELLQRGVGGSLDVGKLQRDGPLGVGDDGRLGVRELGECLFEKRGAAHGGGHEQEARVAHGEQRHLPSDAAILVGVVVELVHDDFAERSGGAIAEGVVGENLGGAAEDRGVAIYGRVAGGHAHVIRPEVAAEGEELLVDERLNGAGVHGAPPFGQRAEMEGGGDERFARAGGGVEDHIAVVE